jgi:hypothetical protein
MIPQKPPQPREQHCCIFHQQTPAYRVYRVGDTVMKRFVEYGLCEACNYRLKKEDSFKMVINERLEELSHKLKKQQEKEKCQMQKEK